MTKATPRPLRLVWDIETNGLLPEVSKIHCIVAIDADTGEEHVFRPHQIKEGLKLLSRATTLIGHNIIGYDLPVLAHLHGWRPPASVELLDTLVMCRLHRPDLKEIDEKAIFFGKFPRQLKNSQSLEAWGLRIGTHKSQFGKTADWSTFSEDMLTYCIQDVRVNVDLFTFLERQQLDPRAVYIENRLALLIQEQEQNGIGFNKEAALELQAYLLNEQAAIADRLRAVFKPWLAPGRLQTVRGTRAVALPQYPDITRPRISEKTGKPLKPYRGPPQNTFTAGEQYVPIKMTEFNPGSRDHVANRLQVLYKWKPTAFTKDGKVKVDADTMAALPESKIPKQVKDDLVEYYALQKIAGMLGQGSQSWLRNISIHDQRIHGRVITNGAVTGRATHRNPNIAQVPKVQLDKDKKVLKGIEGGFGWESRSLFIPAPDRIMVGTDCSGLELRCLGHYLFPYDGGEYARLVVEEDPHEFHRSVLEFDTRGRAKTWIYAFIYGAGGWKLGRIALDNEENDEKLKRRGFALRKKLLNRFTALSDLRDAIDKACDKRPYLIGLDGRRIFVRSKHSALNSLLQSAGAVICKQWIISFHEALAKQGLERNVDYKQVAWVHDEIQVECRPELGELIGKEAVNATIATGEHFGLRCPLSGEFKIGNSWAETH